jgi:hypothetical protein
MIDIFIEKSYSLIFSMALPLWGQSIYIAIREKLKSL